MIQTVKRFWDTAWMARALVAGAALVATTVASADDWSQFRGPNASGVSRDSLPLPARFSNEENVLWSVELAEGIGSPIIAGGNVFVTSLVEGKFVVEALAAADGHRLWRQELETGPLPTIMPPNTHASSTPASDGEAVYTYFSTLGLVAFNAADGRLLWRRPLPEPFYLMAWGAASSPIIYEDLVIFNQDDDLAPFLVAVDKHSGQERWRTERPDMLAGYALPVLCTAGGRTDLVVAGTGMWKGYDPATGEERWSCKSLLRTIMTSPVVQGETVYLAVQSYGDADRVLKFALLEWKDTNQDGKLTKAEVPEPFWEKFDRGDKDGDGLLVDAEIDEAFQSPSNMVGGGSIVQAVRAGGTGDVTDTHVAWTIDSKAASNIASPLLVSERLFVVKQGGISSCFDARTGEPHWTMQRIQNLGNYYASPIAGDGKIFVPGENGFVVVLADSPELDVLEVNDMGDTCIATPAIADGRLFIRTKDRLYAIGNAVQ